MPICAPIRDMKDTAAFAETVHAAQVPAIVTKNGKKALVPCLPKFRRPAPRSRKSAALRHRRQGHVRHRVRTLQKRQDANR